ncbi:MAG: hypothetical protein ACREMW_14090 [Gemmatimonadales bacterium]
MSGGNVVAMPAVVVGLVLAPIVAASAQNFTMSDQLAFGLAAIADTATVEHARCLFGRTWPNTIVADSAVEPEVTRQAGLLVSLTPCPFGAVALWHVHLVVQTRAPSAETACFLSPGDVNAGMRWDAPLVMVVQASGDVWCWWSREDVLDAKLHQLVVSPPPAGHLRRRSTIGNPTP